MGHYRSEMGYEAEDEKRALAEKEQRERMASKIKEDIEKEGVEFVLADILMDPLLAKLRYTRP